MKQKQHYHRHAPTPFRQEAHQISSATLEAMWALFVAIGNFWQNVDDPAPMRSNFEVFIHNRIAFNPMYAATYGLAAEVIEELKEEHGDPGGYAFLFTNNLANEAPPDTPLQWTRQLVSNEFVALQLALGGFKAFGAKNYDGGFIGGPNIPGRPAPYRTLRAEEEPCE